MNDLERRRRFMEILNHDTKVIYISMVSVFNLVMVGIIIWANFNG